MRRQPLPATSAAVRPESFGIAQDRLVEGQCFAYAGIRNGKTGSQGAQERAVVKLPACEWRLRASNCCFEISRDDIRSPALRAEVLY